MWGWIGFALALTLLAITVMLCGCSTTKKSATEDFEKSWLQVLTDSVNVLNEKVLRLESDLKQSAYGHVEFQPSCDTAALRKILTAGKIDPAVIDQYLAMLQQKDNEVEMANDGLIKAKGAIKSATFSYTQAMKLVSELKSKYDSAVLKKSDTKIQTIHHYRTTTITRTIPPLKVIIFLAILLFIGGWYAKKRLGGKTFKLFNKTISI